jgi:hypothetical protein
MENLEPVFLHRHGTDARNVRGLSPCRVPANKLHGGIDCRKDITAPLALRWLR